MITRRKFNKYTTIASLGLAVNPAILKAGSGLDKLKIGQIGTGHSHAAKKYQTLLKLDELFEIVGLVESDALLKQEALLKDEYANAIWMTEQDLLDTPGLQAVLVETDFPELLPTARRCIDAGLHVHIDKPPGNSFKEFKYLLNLASDKKQIVQMGYMYRYHPAFQFCLKSVKEGLLGEIFEVHGVISKKIKEARRKRLAASYGGSMMLLGCHLVDILVAICGKPSSVAAYRKQTYPGRDKLYDNELVVFDYPNATATIRSSLLEVGGAQRRQFVVCGDKGTIQIQPLEPAKLILTLDKASGNFKKGTQHINLPELPGRYDEQLVDFALQIKGKKKSDFSIEHDLNVHETLLRAVDVIR
jgi:predicted dehydrogenase